MHKMSSFQIWYLLQVYRMMLCTVEIWWDLQSLAPIQTPYKPPTSWNMYLWSNKCSLGEHITSFKTLKNELISKDCQCIIILAANQIKYSPKIYECVQR